ncbi:MAG: bifunctional phosphoglucose/phosphomannose isomerase [Candidatus Doudnabacteria bacterium RIFCSPHIGHO2_01_FULL_50_11]|uniref:Bifunctional phosphoglucose/phosphomannose isomerase n=1 Tax=Candidatus Doudnabacteria bacterium RIFCSPHIGHO2_01_FULL_50_11 TaxID=1817828 RepID=A0A1F5PE60_9BACT|nr:MAG: bifunctional phosphoglucose/phosphomannose isomerase [Candidatus Doudnabacteria bacterium RIFCSPHIGHO2_01_FULL_50_11]HLC44308.1 bifunctional phosphoglucose/phosphomannose isomerase [Patescibacteria group bacterium]
MHILMMSEVIKNFPKQFKYRPKIEGGKLKKYKKFLVCGMGGSPQSAHVLKSVMPNLDLTIHKDYGMPAGDWRRTLVVVVSYSGNTEESISALEEAKKQELPIAIIAVGGKLIELAKTYQIPYIQIPDTGIQPRSATGFLFLALLKVMKLNDLIKDSKTLSKTLQPAASEQTGRDLAEKIRSTVPVVYASTANFPLAYMWKIKLNETGKTPAFYNIFPELNHNEMTGFDIKDATKQLSDKFHFIFLKDQEDHPQVQKRFEVTKRLYQDRGLPVEVIELSGTNRLERIFTSLLLADWTSLYRAQGYGLESEQVPMVEEFKKLIA